MNGDVSRKRMKRVIAWMSTVWPTMRNSSGRRTTAVSTVGAPASLSAGFFAGVFGAGAFGSTGGGAAAGDTTGEVCAIAVSQVYGGTTRLTSSMMCDQMKR